MSDQVSEKLARKLASHTTLHHEVMMSIWRTAGLIKPSKLDKAREWCRKVRLNDTLETAYREAVEDTEGYFEEAISEILEERNA